MVGKKAKANKKKAISTINMAYGREREIVVSCM